jgi:hypothetical protein
MEAYRNTCPTKGDFPFRALFVSNVLASRIQYDEVLLEIISIAAITRPLYFPFMIHVEFRQKLSQKSLILR